MNKQISIYKITQKLKEINEFSNTGYKMALPAWI